MAVADVYDALMSRRVYKEGMPHEQALGIIIEGKGSHFDPDIVDAFVEIAAECKAIADRYIGLRRWTTSIVCLSGGSDKQLFILVS